MPDILSEGDIEALLSAMSAEETADAQKVKGKQQINNYNFKRALRFSQDHIRTITRIHEHYPRLMGTYLSTQLRTAVTLQIESIDQLTYDEYIQTIPKGSILNIFSASPLEGNMIMEVYSNIAYTILDRVLGGRGSVPKKASDLTEIETNVLLAIFNRLLHSFQEAWKNIVDVTPLLDNLEMNKHFVQIVSANETVLLIKMQVRIGDTSGNINFCLPHLVLAPIMPQLSVHNWLSAKKQARDQVDIDTLEKNVQLAQLPLMADLGYSEISVTEFLQLSIGDVIRLHEEINDPLVIKVSDKPKFLAQPGIYKGKKAVEIIKPINREENKLW